MKRSRILMLVLLVTITITFPAQAGVRQASGKVTFLRVHSVGTGFGPPNDFLDVEVVIGLDSLPGRAFGFQLRNDATGLAQQGMLNLLREAYTYNWTVT